VTPASGCHTVPVSNVARMNIPSRELTSEDQELIEFARQIVDANTDGEYGVHTMGAAVRGADGQMYGGINLYHFTGGPCAELVALGHARASGAREISTIVAVGNWGRGPGTSIQISLRHDSAGHRFPAGHRGSQGHAAA
jgi:hypothetical protein